MYVCIYVHTHTNTHTRIKRTLNAVIYVGNLPSWQDKSPGRYKG